MASTVQQRLNEVAAVGQEIVETGVAYLDGKFTPLADAKVSIATHALQYGTGVFEGIRAYWSPAEEQLYVFRLREHFERMARSVRIVRITLPPGATRVSSSPGLTVSGSTLTMNYDEALDAASIPALFPAAQPRLTSLAVSRARSMRSSGRTGPASPRSSASSRRCSRRTPER